MIHVALSHLWAEPVLLDALGRPHRADDLAQAIVLLERQWETAPAGPVRAGLERAIALRYGYLHLLERAGARTGDACA